MPAESSLSSNRGEGWGEEAVYSCGYSFSTSALEMKRFIIKLLLVIYVFLFLLAGPISLSVPPADLPVFGLMLGIAVAGLILCRREGRRWKVVWTTGLVISVLGGALEIAEGKRIATLRLEKHTSLNHKILQSQRD